MNYGIIQPGKGIEYKWSSDHIFVKTMGSLAEGRVSMVEDTLNPGFHLGRHHHKKMTEIFGSGSELTDSIKSLNIVTEDEKPQHKFVEVIRLREGKRFTNE
ncbi:MAG: hypothetical protein J5I90_19815, partial [Caldilineales bacterium]|nr:hypothetical protein [Caldilineales bacterium]